MVLAVMKAVNAIMYIEAWKSQHFNGVWTHDLGIPVRGSNQLSYEATDVGSWSFMGPKEAVRNECEVIIWNISFIELWIWNQVSYDTWSYERNLCNCVLQTPEKVRTSMEFEPVISQYLCDALTDWAMKALMWGAGYLWVLRSPCGMNVKL